MFSGSGTTLSSYRSGNSTNGTNRVCVVFAFNESNVTSRVGISFISSSKACRFVEDEIPPGTELQAPYVHFGVISPFLVLSTESQNHVYGVNENHGLLRHVSNLDQTPSSNADSEIPIALVR